MGEKHLSLGQCDVIKSRIYQIKVGLKVKVKVHMLLSQKHFQFSICNPNTVVPALIDTYNQGVERFNPVNQKMYCYVSEGKCHQLTRKMIFSLFSCLIMNQFIVYENSNFGSCMNRLALTKNIIYKSNATKVNLSSVQTCNCPINYFI